MIASKVTHMHTIIEIDINCPPKVQLVSPVPLREGLRGATIPGLTRLAARLTAPCLSLSRYILLSLSFQSTKPEMLHESTLVGAVLILVLVVAHCFQHTI